MVRHPPISDPPYVGALLIIKKIGKSPRYKKSFKKYQNDQAIKDALNDIRIHIKYGMKLPARYNDKFSTNKADKNVGWRNCKPTGKDVILKYRIKNKKFELADIGSHKHVYGSTRRNK